LADKGGTAKIYFSSLGAKSFCFKPLLQEERTQYSKRVGYIYNQMEWYREGPQLSSPGS